MMSAKTDYAVAPGEFLRDWLEETDTTQKQLASDLGVSRKHVSALLSGATLSADIAARLALVTGYSSRWWMRIESQYQADKARLAQEKQLADVADEIKPEVAAFLRSEGFVHSTNDNPGALAAEFFAFFGVATRKALAQRLDFTEFDNCPTRSENSDRQAEAVWLRAGELKVNTIWPGLPRFDVRRVYELLSTLQSSPTGSSEERLNSISDSLGSAGVGLIIMPGIEGWGVRGSIRCVHDRPVIQVSDQAKNDSGIWLALLSGVDLVVENPLQVILR